MGMQSPSTLLKIPSASCRESPKCKEVFYCNSLANPQQAAGLAHAVHFQEAPSLMVESFTEIHSDNRKILLFYFRFCGNKATERLEFREAFCV